MAPHCDGNPRRAATLALFGLLVLAPPRAPAQGFEGDGSSYSRQTSFTISFSMTDARERRIRQVYLHASEDYGRTYHRVSQALPTDRAFRFEARRDGWYWFAVQTEDADGRFYPPRMDGATPEQKLCVDRIKPRVVLRPAAPRDGAVGVEWEVSDTNLDLPSLRLDYRAAGARDWVPLGAPRLAAGDHYWAPATAGPLQVRLEVRDKAQNQADAVVTLTPGGAAPGAGGVAAGVGGVMHVRSRTFQLDYTLDNIGQSGVKSVDVWLAQKALVWKKDKSHEAKPAGPSLVTITVPTEGRWGITLIPQSGVGLADPPPRTGEAPQVWVEVDESKPRVVLQRVDVGRGPDAGRFTVWFQATDPFLRAHPITISYRGKSDEEWKPLASGVDNIKYWTGSTEGLPYEFFVRVEAVDEAGNVGIAQTPQTVKVDLKVPRARIGNVKVAPSPMPNDQ